MDKVHQNDAYEEQTGTLTNSLKRKSEGGYNIANITEIEIKVCNESQTLLFISEFR